MTSGGIITPFLYMRKPRQSGRETCQDHTLRGRVKFKLSKAGSEIMLLAIGLLPRRAETRQNRGQ